MANLDDPVTVSQKNLPTVRSGVQLSPLICVYCKFDYLSKTNVVIKQVISFVYKLAH